MSLADLSIRRPTFITCVVFLMIVLGLLFMSKMGVDLFPDVTFPVVTITTPYPGAAPTEIETLVTKPLEDEISTLSGIKRLSSSSFEGVSQLVAEFTLETDVKYAEQQIRDRVSSTRSLLPLDVKESVIRRIDPADQPVLVVSLAAEGLSESKLFDLADDRLRPQLEQVNQVGLVQISGGRKREIQIQLKREELKSRELSVTAVASRLSMMGANMPNGKVDSGKQQVVFRTLGEFQSMGDIEQSPVTFFGNDISVQVRDVGKVVDTLEDETSRAYFNGKKAMTLSIYRQSGSNTIAVVDALNKKIQSLNVALKREEGSPQLSVVRDTSTWIRANVDDVKESIFIGTFLAVIVVFFFLGSARSTLITGLALPNSLIGAFILMGAAGFSINIMTLLALSLAVGLLVDDAIVVRENIFRHLEMGKSPIQAAREGTKEVTLAVIATTLAVVAVFGPVGFLKGVTGQFFKQFGLTICFAMLISLFDALTIAPMLSAYFAGNLHAKKKKTSPSFLNFIWKWTLGGALASFDRFQTFLEKIYESVIRFTIRHPLKVLVASFMIFLGSCSLVRFVPKTFLPPQDAGEFSVGLDLPPGTSLDEMTQLAKKVDEVVRSNPEVLLSSLTVGDRNGQAEQAELYVRLVSIQQRTQNTSQFKDHIRQQLLPFAHANPKVKDYDAVGAGQRPFNLLVMGSKGEELEGFAQRLLERLKSYSDLLDVDMNYRPGKPEFQVVTHPAALKNLGIPSKALGQELRNQVAGAVVGKFREEGREYDIRIRLQEGERDLQKSFKETVVPNLNQKLIRLSDVASGREATGPATINRQDRSRMIALSADIRPGAGLSQIMTDVSQILEKDLQLPPSMRYVFTGQAENFQELATSMTVAMGLGILFIFLVLASLYESFVTPLTIMLALPLALCGSFAALFITQESLNIFSMIGCIMLLGVATKNSILLVDYAHHLIAEGMDRSAAIIQAGKTRLRPILMTTMALIAGTIPIALGLNEASRQRTSMGVSIMGGLITSTLLTLIVIPAAFSFLDRFRVWSKSLFSRWVGATSVNHGPLS